MKKAYISWGILGQAKIARDLVAPAIHRSKYGALTALATRSPESSGEWKEQYPGITIHGSYEELLSDPGVDALYIPLPNHLHVQWTSRALGAGKHVLCEKPIALQAEEIEKLIDLGDKAGLLAAEAFMVVHHPQWLRVRELLSAGEIGELRHVQGAFTYNNVDDPTNIRNRADTGGGALRDIGVYPSVTCRFATGKEPGEIRSTLSYESGVDVTARVEADFPGFTLAFYCSMRMARYQEMLFHGSKGFIKMKAPFNAGVYDAATLTIGGSDGTIRTESFHNVDHYQLQVEAFNRSILFGEPYPCPLKFSRANQEMIDRIYRAGVPDR